MGFSVSASTAIIFAGLFLAAGTLYPAVSNAHERVTDAEIDRTDARLDMRNTEINITAVDTGTPSIGVRNEGSTSLDADEIDLVVDGEYQPRSDYDVSDGGVWFPGETITIDNFPTPTDSVKIVTDHGISESEVV
ncbi:flagellin [Halohasta salina]|uniref:flagellin n=1 Tax=Halohasta salina TaxID=2961621 RepID=UPI0020A5A577|nr:flagellin [Halohasta salina]